MRFWYLSRSLSLVQHGKRIITSGTDPMRFGFTRFDAHQTRIVLMCAGAKPLRHIEVDTTSDSV